MHLFIIFLLDWCSQIEGYPYIRLPDRLKQIRHHASFLASPRQPGIHWLRQNEMGKLQKGLANIILTQYAVALLLNLINSPSGKASLAQKRRLSAVSFSSLSCSTTQTYSSLMEA